jgi:hypothetical protein
VGCYLAVELLQGEAGGQLDLPAHRRRDGIAVQANLLGFGLPALAQVSKLKPRLLAFASGERGDLTSARGGTLPGRLEYFRAPGRERLQPLVLEALDLGDALPDRLPLDSERPGQLVAKVRLIDVAGGLGVFVDRGVVEAGPFAVWALGRVGDQDMGVELRIAVARGAVRVGDGDESAAFDEDGTAFAPAGQAGVGLHVFQRASTER